MTAKIKNLTMRLKWSFLFHQQNIEVKLRKAGDILISKYQSLNKTIKLKFKKIIKFF